DRAADREQSRIVPVPGNPAFGMLQGPYGAPVFLGPVGAGDYMMSVAIDGQPVTAYPFSLSAPVSDDPFAPPAGLEQQGPWSAAPFVIKPLERPNEAMAVGLWVNAKELGSPQGQTGSMSLHLMHGGEQFAAFEGGTRETQWTFVRADLQHKSTQMNGGPFR